MRIRPLLTISVMSVLTAAMSTSGAASPAVPGAATPVEPPGERDVIVQLFQWNWRSVGPECGDVLGPAGYGGEPIQAAEYVGNGDVLTFPYGTDLGRIFRSEKLAYLRTFGSTLPSESVVVFTDNHDTQRSGDPNVLTFRDHGRYALANAFMLAWPYGTPKVMSSYSYGSSDEGPPSTVDGTTSDATCFDGHWVCEHRWRVIANLVGFHNAVDGSDVRLWWDNGNDLIAFGRGEAGYLVINDEDAAATGRRWQTALPAGVYCDVIHGDLIDGACTGPTYAVGSDGWFTADIAAHDGLALHVGARVG